MKKLPKILAFWFWLLVSLALMFQGFRLLYKYSQPDILWLYIVPISISFSFLTTGALGFLLAIKQLSHTKNSSVWLAGICSISAFHFLMILIFHGWFYLEYHLQMAAIAIISLTAFYKKPYQSNDFYRSPIIWVLLGVLAFLPWILPNFISYDPFNFLHPEK